MLLTIEETAQELKVSGHHVRRMIAVGKFPHYLVGNRAIRLDLEEIKSICHNDRKDEETQVQGVQKKRPRL